VDFARRDELCATFEDAAPVYDRARPRYPEALFDDLFEVTRLAPPSRVLEIGPGTGIATRVLANRGLRVVGIELSARMASEARANLPGRPSVEIVTGSFETGVPGRRFDAILAFSAFHWIDPGLRYSRASSLLRDSGFLAVANARLVAPAGADPFFSEVDEDYEAILGESAHAPGAPGLASLRDEMSESGVFAHVAARRYRWRIRYTADGYLDLLDTLPWHRALEPPQRVALYGRIRRRILDRRKQTVEATFDAVLDVARKT
jgi:SAM-dependent methyltransferase